MNGIYAIIVTYGNRWKYLKEVVFSALEEGVDQIIIIDNNSNINTRNNLKLLENKNENRVRVIYLDKNFGSAGGFFKGLETAYNEKKCKFIWLLDDDNRPKRGSLNALIDTWHKHRLNEEEKFALLSIRKNIINITQNTSENFISFGIGRKNSFVYLDIREIPKKILRYFKRSVYFKAKSQNQRNNVIDFDIKIKVAPYGGLFFEKAVIDKIGLPNTEYFTYLDDFDWTWRLTKYYGNIYLVPESEIEDIEKSWNINKKSTFHAMRKEDDFRIYYFLRNRIYFESKIFNINSNIYKINKFIFILISKVFLSKKKYKIVKRAIEDGENGIMGTCREISI